jgi:hypothetical protein
MPFSAHHEHLLKSEQGHRPTNVLEGPALETDEPQAPAVDDAPTPSSKQDILPRIIMLNSLATSSTRDDGGLGLAPLLLLDSSTQTKLPAATCPNIPDAPDVSHCESLEPPSSSPKLPTSTPPDVSGDPKVLAAEALASLRSLSFVSNHALFSI